ncbi:MAG TPA: 5-formyltetrahydrofolate cyclo-ligase [Chitinophagaceae bacterium]|nr:5-formyltetrahydrofolate cyclo-ligase [Chitinophagaceae bacterium]
MLKKDARKKYRAERQALTATQRSRLDDLLLIQFQKLALPPLQSLLSFYPMEEKGEINTFLLTDFLCFRNPGLALCYPKTNVFQNTMQAIMATDETEFDTNEYGIPEPVQGAILEPYEIDAVLVPMLAFDKKGNRVGYGKGFYDRFLQDCSDDCLKIGLCYAEALERIDDASSFDVPLNYCITPQTSYVF